ncbi:MAG TPA: tetratricopeptide repeat protein [Ktedonobacteraceae bacterium]|nr:tetratricopeptide repeat protein [Ktedonobacteraceae bacterium]
MENDRKFPLNPYLRIAREERGWSQQDLAERVGTTAVTVSRWENGQTFPSPYFRQKLCEAFDKKLAELGLIPEYESIIWNMPNTRNPYFTGREPLLRFLHERLSTARTAALTQTHAQALYGLGGIGKTQTAAEYAFRYSGEYRGVYWIRAATRETLVADYVALAELLELSGKDKQDQQIVAAVKRWLAAHEDWLLILDNADDLRLAQQFLPTSHKGYILFTTRAQASGAIAASVEVEKLQPRDGILLLLRWSKLLNVDALLEQARAEDRAGAERIVREMDGLPLALVQAAAYVEETGCSLAEYLQLYDTHRKDLLARRSNLPLDYTETVATTWELSFQQVEQQNPAAADILRLCAFLAADAIPQELLMRAIDETGAEASDSYKLNAALEVLRRYSLVRRDGDTNMLSIHRLVQAVLRESMDEQTQRLWAERTVRAVNVAFPETDYGTGATQQNYLPHVQECTALIEQYHLYFSEATQLLYKAGDFLYFQGFYPQSRSLHQQALMIREQVYGSDDPAIAESLNALAVLSRLEGNFEQAERFHRQALSIREKALGLDHPATILSLNNLGILYSNQRKYELAEPLLKQALNIRERILGSEHPNTLMSFLNLAKLYLEQHNYVQAEQLLKQTLATCERTLEPEHTLIAQNLNLLARLHYEQGDYERAEVFWKQSLAILEKTLGSEHPATAGVLNALAELYFAQGRHTQAQFLCQKALSICENILGPEHPDTIAYREHLSRIVSKREAEQDDDHHSAPPPR